MEPEGKPQPDHLDIMAGMVAMELLSKKEGLETATRIDVEVMQRFGNSHCSVMYFYACYLSNVHLLGKEFFSDMREYYARYVTSCMYN